VMCMVPFCSFVVGHEDIKRRSLWSAIWTQPKRQATGMRNAFGSHPFSLTREGAGSIWAQLQVRGLVQAEQCLEPSVDPGEPEMYKVVETVLTPPHSDPFEALLDKPLTGTFAHPRPQRPPQGLVGGIVDVLPGAAPETPTPSSRWSAPCRTSPPRPRLRPGQPAPRRDGHAGGGAVPRRTTAGPSWYGHRARPRPASTGLAPRGKSPSYL
jgi:hypothetical protein